MPHDKDDEHRVIPVDLIHETVMPPYEYQKPQNGFGSTGLDQSSSLGKEAKTQDVN